MYRIARVLPVFAVCIALTGCGDGSIEIKSRPAAPSTVIIEKPSPTTVIVEKPSSPTIAKETVRTETRDRGGSTTKTTTAVKTIP